MQHEDIWQQGAEENIRTWKELTRGWRKLHNEDLDDLYSSLNVRWSGQEEWIERDLWHLCGRKKMHTALGCQRLREVGHL
jgi:hypothetical protein